MCGKKDLLQVFLLGHAGLLCGYRWSLGLHNPRSLWLNSFKCVMVSIWKVLV